MSERPFGYTAEIVLKNVEDALQDCEEMIGPGEEAYVPIMRAVIKMAEERIAGFHANPYIDAELKEQNP